MAQSESLYKAPRTTVSQDQGKFRTHFNFPGRNLPDHGDHGYGPLATVVESFMDPGTLIGMHPHRNEEIISWVPEGVMRHDDRQGNELVTDPENLLVMNAGREFWHEERTLDDDPPLRMLQIFVRPHSLGLEPGIQHEPIPAPVAGEWRHLFGPDGAGAPASVRNQVHCHDIRVDAGTSVDLPTVDDWDTYFYVFEGEVTVDGTRFGRTESGLLVEDTDAAMTAATDAVVVAFNIDPTARVTRQGTIGR
ncbi:pirin family protein [Haloarcula laminariae]|uniref:pirin family protein n=1 Tax=Haloarcula laminariae TaxID=2961577 RepID=UPI0024051ABC|nr:pirin family protein [Halomicroarcula sp. FL173]